MITKYGIWNITLQKWVPNEDYQSTYSDFDRAKVQNMMEQLLLIDEAGFKAGAKKQRTQMEVREIVTFQ